MVISASIKTAASTVFVTSISIIQLLQVLSFIKYAPKSGTWNSSSDNFFRFCKDLGLRFDDEIFISLYIASSLISVLSFVLYLAFTDFVHKLNKTSGVGQLVLNFFEYILFGLLFIPMITKFVEVQICDTALNIDSYTSVACFKNDQLVLLELGFFCIGLCYIMNAVIFPTLKCERDSVDRLWGNESYVEGFYYLALIGTVSLLGYIRLPWVGILLAGVFFVYMCVMECYQSVAVACGRCGIMAALVWAFASAYVLDSNQDAANVMLYLLPLAYVIGYAIRLVKGFIVKRDLKNIPLAKN